MAAPTTFNQLFDTAKPDNGGGCPAGFRPIDAEFKHECLALRPGMDIAASRLETGRYAAYRGASTEFRKLKGATFDADTSRLYISVSRIKRGLLDGDKKHDKGGPNDVRMAENRCGAVYALDAASGRDDSIGGAIDSAYAFDKMYPLVAGRRSPVDRLGNRIPFIASGTLCQYFFLLEIANRLPSNFRAILLGSRMSE